MPFRPINANNGADETATANHEAQFIKQLTTAANQSNILNIHMILSVSQCYAASVAVIIIRFVAESKQLLLLHNFRWGKKKYWLKFVVGAGESHGNGMLAAIGMLSWWKIGLIECVDWLFEHMMDMIIFGYAAPEGLPQWLDWLLSSKILFEITKNKTLIFDFNGNTDVITSNWVLYSPCQRP